MMAGVGKMKYRTFLMYNLMGGFLWAVGVTTLGYALGDQIGADNIDKYLLPIIAVVIFISILPAVIEVLQAPPQGQGAGTLRGRGRADRRASARSDRRVALSFRARSGSPCPAR